MLGYKEREGKFLNKNVVISMGTTVCLGKVKDVNMYGVMLCNVHWLSCDGGESEKIKNFAACPKDERWHLISATPMIHISHMMADDIYLLSDETEEWFEKEQKSSYICGYEDHYLKNIKY